jgi:hypothetical protein
MTEDAKDKVFNDRVRCYAEILNPLFDATEDMRVDRLFEFVCVLVRAAGIQDAEWDPWHESQAMLRDLGNLAKIQLPSDVFPQPDRTRMRLFLIQYCHITEMDLPYELVANLLRLRIGKKYDTNPFSHLARFVGKKEEGPFRRVKRPSPKMKLGHIKQLAKEAKMSEVGEAFESIHDGVIRNAVYHSDYTLADGEFRLLRDYHHSKKKSYRSQVITFEELDDLLMDAFAFYIALFSLYERCRKSFSDFEDVILPYDLHYKGLLQFIFDDEHRLIGFRTYWPNQSRSEFCRTERGCAGVNLHFDPDGSINFMVGLYASKRGEFSPLVEHDAEPTYSMIPGTNVRPYWPEKLAAYKLPQGDQPVQSN